jgi:hypothetical protein
MENSNRETTYTIRIDSSVWEEFKRCITKEKTMNDAIVELIVEKIRKGVGE